MRPATWNHRHQTSTSQTRSSIVELSRLARLAPHITLLLVLALLTWVGFHQLTTPEVVPLSAPVGEFSGARAMDHLRVIASQPRAVGSPGYLASQTYLVEQLRAIGMDPTIQTTSVVVPGEDGAEGFAGATVHNIVARLPGTNSTGAIALNAHYDSGSTGPGAMDDGSGVVTVLETVRAIQVGSPLRNDVIVVFADAEEVGMLGATAFNEQHPWADDVRLAFNYEGAGGTGPSILYATSNQDSWLVSEYLKAAPDPSASSLLTQIVDLYSGGRLDCDLGEYTSNGSDGLGFVVLGNTPDYHTVLDNPDVIDAGSIQQEGANTLAAVRHFGNLDLSQTHSSDDRVFFNIWPGLVVHYPESWVIPLAALVTVLIGGLSFFGMRRNLLTLRGLIAGATQFLLSTTLSIVITTLLWFLIHYLVIEYQVMLIGTYQATFYVVSFSILTLAIMAALYALAGRWIQRNDLLAGVLVGALLPLWFASLVVPGMSYLVIWPLLFGTLPLAWKILTGTRGDRPWPYVAVLSVAAAPIFVLLPGTLQAMMGFVNRMEGLTGIGLLGVLMLCVAPLAGLLLPHLQFLTGEADANQHRRWIVPASAGLLAMALLLWGVSTVGFDANHPRPNQISYHLNADTGTAEWVSIDRNLDSWTEQFIPSDTSRSDYDSTLLGTLPAFVASAPVVAVASPEISVMRDSSVGDLRTIELRFTSPRGAPLMAADIRSTGELTRLAVNGRDIDLSEYAWARSGSFPVIYHNAPPEGWTLLLEVRGTGPIEIGVEESKDGLPDVPGISIQPRPADMMPAPGYARDPTVVSKTFHFD